MTETTDKPTRAQLIDMLLEMNLSIEKLPTYALTNPINHYDFSALIILLNAIFNTEK